MSQVQKPHLCLISQSKVTYALLMGEKTPQVGGAEVQQALLAAALVKLGFPVTYLVPDFGQPLKTTTATGITLIKIRPRSGRFRGLKFLDEILRVLQAMKRADADVYYQQAGSPVTGIAALYGKMKRKPFVFSLASNMDLDGSWKRGLKPQYYLLYKYGLTHATAIIAQTEDQIRMLKENVHKEGVLIRNTYEAPDGSNRPSESRYILWVGNFWAVKRPAMFLELAEKLPQYQFVMVGGPHGGEEHVFEEVREKARDVSNLQFVGPVPYADVGQYFDGASVFINTSATEGFPSTYMQSWSRGVPVIATFDADKLITRYGLGRHCTDLDELAAAVDEFVQDEELRASSGERAAKYVREHHSLEVFAAKHAELFMQLYRGEKPGA